MSLPFISTDINSGEIIEEDTDGVVRELVPKAVSVAVVDPFGDEERRVRLRPGIATHA